MNTRILSVFAFVLLLIGTFSCTAQQSDHVTLIDKTIYQEMARATEFIQLVDVRTPDEYANGRIDQAVNIDFYADDFVSRCEEEFDKEQPLVVYCQAGGRSAKAAKKLEEAGFKTIYDVDGGYSQWED